MRLSLTIAAMLTLVSLPARAAQISGTWLTEDGSTKVQFEPCGDLTCGRITWLKDAVDPETGKEWRDKFNSDQAARNAKLVGLAIVRGLKQTAPGTWSGEIYDPQDGKTYSGAVYALDAARLSLKGCALAGLICQTETWTKVAP